MNIFSYTADHTMTLNDAAITSTVLINSDFVVAIISMSVDDTISF